MKFCNSENVTAAGDTAPRRDVTVASYAISCKDVTTTSDTASCKDVTTTSDTASRKDVTTTSDAASCKDVTTESDTTSCKDVTTEADTTPCKDVTIESDASSFQQHRSSRIKICGLTRQQDIQYVNDLMPDYIGFVFAPGSKRYITPEHARELRRQLSPSIKAVGVFVNEPLESLLRLIHSGVIDVIQLHGQEDENYIKALRRETSFPIIKACSIECAADVKAATQSTADFLLLDQGKGGTGKAFDWTLVKDLSRPYFLAGGLSADNVGTALSLLQPYALDVSSGVETNGQKDPQKLRDFIDTVRRNELVY